VAFLDGYLYVADTGNDRVQKVQVGEDTEPDDPKPPPDEGNGSSSSPKRPNITRVRIIPNRGWVYADGYVNLQVQVTNAKNAAPARNVVVYLWTNRKRKVKITRQVRIGLVRPGWTVTKSFKVEPQRNAYGSVQVSAKAEGRVNKSVLKLIRPWWPAANGRSGGQGKPGGQGGGDGGGGTASSSGITRVRIIPNRGWVYADGYVDMQVQVTNAKNAKPARNVVVYLWTNRRRKVKITRQVRIGLIRPGWTVTRNFKVEPKRSAYGFIRVTAKAEGRVNNSVLKLIRPWW
jgi:hypothetical protein